MRSAMLPSGPKGKPAKAGAAAVPAESAGIHSILEDLPVLRGLSARLGVCELRRRLAHMSPICLPFLLWVIPHRDPWGPILINAVLAIAVTLVGMLLVRFRSIARSQDEHGMAAVIGYAVPIIIAVLLLPDRAELGMMTLAILAIGDGSATMAGMCLGGRPLPWNRRKTLTGLLSFCLFGTLMATIVYWGEARPGISWESALLCAGISTLAAAIVESLPLRWNDNLSVGTTAAAVGAFIQIVCLGH